MKTRWSKRKLPFQEGTWFGIPMQRGGYGVGRVARLSPKGDVRLGYFFGPKHQRLPKLTQVEALEPRDAVKVIQTSELGLLDGTWPIIGASPVWDREKWPIPPFIRRDPLSERAWRVIYADDNP